MDFFLSLRFLSWTSYQQRKDYRGFVCCHLIDDMTFPFHLSYIVLVYIGRNLYFMWVYEIAIKLLITCNFRDYYSSRLLLKFRRISTLNPFVNPSNLLLLPAVLHIVLHNPKIMCRKLKPSSCNPRSLVVRNIIFWIIACW